MNQTVLEIIKLLVTAAVVVMVYLIRSDLIPYFKQRMTADQLKTAKEYADTFVKMADQVFKDKDGAERKAIVTKALKDALIAVDISISDQLMDDIIEATVKGLRIAENSKDNLKITVKEGGF